MNKIDYFKQHKTVKLLVLYVDKNGWSLIFAKLFVFYCDSYTVRIICDEHVFFQNMINAVIIHLQPWYTIKRHYFTLFSYQKLTNTIDFQSRIYAPSVTKINHLLNISNPIKTVIGLNVSDINKTFKDLSLQIKSIQQNSRTCTVFTS